MAVFEQSQQAAPRSLSVGAIRARPRSLSVAGTASGFFANGTGHGNQAAQRLAQSCSLFPARCPSGGACHSCPARVQAKLTVNPPDDQYEQEADSVADAVMAMPEPAVQRACSSCDDEESVQAQPLAAQITPLVQRQAEPAEEKEDEEPVQAAALDSGSLQRQEEESEEEEETPIQAKAAFARAPAVTPEIRAGLEGMRGAGHPMDSSELAFFEPRFGRSLGEVRLHTDSRAAEVAGALKARAFTLHQNIVLAAGQYAPGTDCGRRLLAHELTHVLQQPSHRNGGHSESRTSPLPIDCPGCTRSNVIARWKAVGDTRIVDKKSDRLWHLAERTTGDAGDWPCIRPISMNSRAAWTRGYWRALTIGDSFDISLLTATSGTTVSLIYRVKPLSLQDVARLYRVSRWLARAQGGHAFFVQACAALYGGTAAMDGEGSIWELHPRQHGDKPIQQLTLVGHVYGDRISGDDASFEPGRFPREKPRPDIPGGNIPRRCWFTKNAVVRIVGCTSEKVAERFARAYLRPSSSAVALGTNRDLCGGLTVLSGWHLSFPDTKGHCVAPPLRPVFKEAAALNAHADTWSQFPKRGASRGT